MNTNIYDARGKRRLRVLRGYSAQARYLATIDEQPTAWIGRSDVADIVTPYAYSPSIGLRRDAEGRFVFVAETRHRRFEVWEWTGSVYPSDEVATAFEVAARSAEQGMVDALKRIPTTGRRVVYRIKDDEPVEGILIRRRD